jgi:thiamine-phosphate pyrophosphorylase
MITDRHVAGGIGPLLERIASNVAAGLDWIQIREKDLPDRPLLELARSIMSIRGKAQVLINGRADIAIASGAHGVHLPSRSLPPADLRRIVPAGFLIGVSCHTLDELRAAESGGASYAVYGPVFAPLSKPLSLAPIGLDGLAGGCRAVAMPVLALGGITTANAASCMEAGAAGVAGISIIWDPSHARKYRC